MKVKAGSYLLVAVAAFMILAIVHYAVGMILPQTKEHVTAEEAPVILPDGAKDISFCQTPLCSNTIVEFTAEEKEFVEWAKSKNIEVKEIGDAPYIIDRFIHPENPESAESHATIKKGCFFEEKEASGEDVNTAAAYDRDSQRGYFLYHTH